MRGLPETPHRIYQIWPGALPGCLFALPCSCCVLMPRPGWPQRRIAFLHRGTCWLPGNPDRMDCIRVPAWPPCAAPSLSPQGFAGAEQKRRTGQAGSCAPCRPSCCRSGAGQRAFTYAAETKQAAHRQRRKRALCAAPYPARLALRAVFRIIPVRISALPRPRGMLF